MSTALESNVLTFNDIVDHLRATFETFTDRRTGKNSQYTMTDAALSAFSVFFMQSPSFLDFQRTMQETQGKNNAQTLFGVFRIPTDNQIRTLLDAVKEYRKRNASGALYDDPRIAVAAGRFDEVVALAEA